MTPEMKSRVEAVGGQWNDEGGGYWSLHGLGPVAAVAYVAIPEEHPLNNIPYCRYSLDDCPIGVESIGGGPDVNGGLTFGHGNVFGWDYGHLSNRSDIVGDISRALEFFRWYDKWWKICAAIREG